jgi:hypothetical protein
MYYNAVQFKDQDLNPELQLSIKIETEIVSNSLG